MLGQVPKETKAQGLFVLIGVLALLGLMLILFLGWCWRRYNARLASRRPREPMPDIWQVGGERLASRLDDAFAVRDAANAPPPPDDEPPTAADDEEEPGDDEQDDDDQPGDKPADR